ncbi:MAG: hypothetical protein HZC36_05740 [Armatimonadetes bacterium]|nr:hypothetical protein [Armatimonadota bacterium]
MLASWIIGLLLLKLLISNLGAVLGIVIGGLEGIGSFLFGQSLGAFFGGLFQIAVVCAIMWLGFRRILGQNSLPVKAFENVLKSCARQIPHLLRWSVKVFMRAVSGAPKQSGPSSDARRD